mmetsp:Transcript_111900/g.316854  ORF Transcript_111900/g.316854 Transcript_111900/m.316854 type:complete len:629 (+) Transcript_111900:1-1887(+)
MPPMMRPPGADWAAEFAPRPQQMMMPPPGSAEMDAAFRQAHAAGPAAATAPLRPQMDGAWQAMGPARPMGPMPMLGGPMMMGPGPMMMGGGPMLHSGAPPPMAAAPFVQAAARPPGPAEDMEAAFAEAQMEDAFKEAQQESQEQADLGQAAQMVEMLRNSGNPKFANSQFVSFIDKVSKGDLQFKENTVVDRNGQQVDWDTLYDTDAATASDVERNVLENLWKASSSDAQPSTLESAWNAAGPALDDAWQAAGGQMPNDLEAMWANAKQSMNLDDMWGADAEAAMMEQAWMGDEFGSMEQMWGSAGARTNEYTFQEDNSFLDDDDPLALGLRLLKEGRDKEALLAFEAEVQRNAESSEGWRHLGQLYAELDQDVEAIQCLRRGHQADPYNLNSLLALGVSCTNELDQLPALRYLRMWIENHEEHQQLVDGLEPPSEYEYEAWRQQVTALFNSAAQANPLDANVFVALGVMENINRNYDNAVQALATACRLRPNDHTMWNKLGATLANSGKSEQALIAYHQGLTLKPNYARSWSNLAIAHANLGHHGDAAKFYLSSLVLNPDATHIWNFLHSAVLNMNEAGNMSAIEAIDQRDLGACTRLFDGVLDPGALPTPADLDQPPDQILASIGL